MTDAARRRPRRTLLACAAVLLALAAAASTATAGPASAASGTAAGPSTGSATPAVTGTPPAQVVDRVITDDRVSEDSGIVVSRRIKGLVWTFNDSGGGPELFGIDRKGEVAARLDVRGAENVDWESATPVTGPGGRLLIAIGDTGDNKEERPAIRIFLVDEPTSTGRTRERPYRTLRLTYPDQPADAEAIFEDPATHRLYVVTKGLVGGRLFAVPASVWPGTTDVGDQAGATLEPVADVPLRLVTDAVALPDRRVAVRTYGQLALMPPVDRITGGVWTPLAKTALPAQPQGEGIGLEPDGTFLLSTEGVGKPVLRFVAPRRVLRAGLTPTATTASTGTGDPAAPAPSGRGGTATAVLALAGAAGAALLVVVAAMLVRLRLRRRRRPGAGPR